MGLCLVGFRGGPDSREAEAISGSGELEGDMLCRHLMLHRSHERRASSILRLLA